MHNNTFSFATKRKNEDEKNWRKSLHSLSPQHLSVLLEALAEYPHAPRMVNLLGTVGRTTLHW